MPQAVPIISAISSVVGVGTAIRSSVQQGRARREQRKLQRVQEKRARSRVFAEQQRALGLAQVALGARGASVSSAAATVPGSIQTQAAGEQGFLTQVSNITGSFNAFAAGAQRAVTFGSLTNIISQGVQLAEKQGLFSPSPSEGTA